MFVALNQAEYFFSTLNYVHLTIQYDINLIINIDRRILHMRCDF